MENITARNPDEFIKINVVSTTNIQERISSLIELNKLNVTVFIFH